MGLSLREPPPTAVRDLGVETGMRAIVVLLRWIEIGLRYGNSSAMFRYGIHSIEP